MSSLISALEQLAANAWPAAETASVDGWLCRYAASSSRRLNSVLPLQTEGQLGLDERIAAVEQFYSRRQTPARFQVSPAAAPYSLDDDLKTRGYDLVGTILVQTAAVKDVQTRCGRLTSGRIVVADQCPDSWFDTYLRAEPGREKTAADRRAVLARIAPPTAYVTWEVVGEAAAIGLGVLEQGWLGVFCMATLPAYRRQGGATAILGALAEWGAGQGAEESYLQLFARNAAALAVYGRAGFTTLYPYHFRERAP